MAAPSTALAVAQVFVLQSGPAVKVENDFQAAGRASAELAGGGSVGDGTFAFVGSAYADNRRGALGGAVTTTGSGYEARSDRLGVKAWASIDDRLQFSETGPITFRLAVQGSFDVDPGGQARSFAKLAVVGSQPSQASAFARGPSSFSVSNVTHATVISPLQSNYIVWLERTFLADAGAEYSIKAELEVYSTPPTTGSAYALFSHTAQLAIFMPEGVSFTSQSGDFMADVRSPVPEPATLWLWLLGVLWLLGIGRRGSGRLLGDSTNKEVCT